MNTQNLQVVRFLIYALSVIAFFFQIGISDGWSDMTCIFILFITNIFTAYYCFNKKYFFEYPISLFMIWFSHFTNSGGALYLKSLELSEVTDQLKLPLSTITLISLFTLLIIISHTIYRNSFKINKIRTTLCNFYSKHHLIEINNVNFLYFIGIIGIASRVYYYDFNIILGEQAGISGPRLFQDIMIGFQYFSFAPIIIVFSPTLYGTQEDKKGKWLILFYCLILLFISLSRNSRGSFFDVIFSFFLIYFLMFLFGFIKLNRNFYIKFIVSILLIIPTLNFFDNFSKTYLLVRGETHTRTPIQNVKSFFSVIGSNEQREENFQRQQAMEKGGLFAETYYKNTLYNRLNVLLIHDNINLVGRELSKNQKENLKKFELGRLISIAPQPIINMFTNDFNKRDYLKTSVGSFMYNAIDPARYPLHLNIGSMLMEIYMFTGYWLPIIVLLICIPIFILCDSFYNKKLLVVSPIILILLYQTGGSISNYFATDGFSSLMSLTIRIIPQTILFYFILMKFFLYFTKRA